MKHARPQLLATMHGLGVLVALVSLWPAIALAAQEDDLVVVLRGGKEIRGDLLSLTQEETSVRSSGARSLRFSSAKIVRLDSSVPYLVEVATGETLNGPVSIRTRRRRRVLYVGGAEPRHLAVSKVVSISPVSVKDEDAKEEGANEKEEEEGPKEPRAPEREKDDSPAPTKAQQESVTKMGKPLPEEEDVHKLFLRQMSVLLARREMELSVGLSYMYSRLYDPTQNRLTYSRHGQLSLALSVGLASFIQATVAAPLVFHQRHDYSYTDSREEVSQSLRPGNVTWALSVQVLRATGAWPDIMLFSSLSIPLGSDSASTGEQSGKVDWGFWSTAVGISFVKVVDPVSLFAGASYSHSFEKTVAGQRMQVGDFWGYFVGLGLAVNGKVSLSTNLRGGWEAPTLQDGRRIVDTEAEPMSLGLGVIYAIAKSWYVAPGLSFPVNVDGGTVVVRLPIAHRF